MVVVGEGIMRHYDPPPDPNFLPCDFTDWAAQHQGTKAQAPPLPVDQHRPIELIAFSQPVQFSSSKLNFCPKKARCHAWCSKSPKMLAKNAVPFICGPMWVSPQSLAVFLLMADCKSLRCVGLPPCEVLRELAFALLCAQRVTTIL